MDKKIECKLNEQDVSEAVSYYLSVKHGVFVTPAEIMFTIQSNGGIEAHVESTENYTRESISVDKYDYAKPYSKEDGTEFLD